MRSWLATAGTDTFTVDDLAVVLLVAAVVLVVAVAAVRLSTRSGLPSLLLYLAIGLVLGEAGLGIQWDSTNLTRVLGYAALVIILIEGGLTTRWEGIRRSVAPAAVLATVGVAVSVAVIALVARFALRLDWSVAILLGGVLASTDAAAVFSVLRRVPLPRSVTGMLEAESGFNDAPVVLLVVALSEKAVAGNAGHSWWALAGIAVLELAGGVAIGLAVGYAGGWLMRRIAMGASTLFAIGVVAVAILAYAVADLAHTSGFIATYLAALLLGNLGLPHRPAVHGFATALGWLAQIGLFVLLGLLAHPGGFAGEIGPALIIGLALLLFARPLSVIVSATPFRTPWRTQVFLSWAGLRGAVPIVLATVPITAGVPGVDWLLDLVFVLVVVFTSLQAPTLPWLARRLGLESAHHSVDLDIETTPLDELGAQILEIAVGPTSRIGGVRVFELRLPVGANVALVVRSGQAFVPTETSVLRHGDRLLVVTPERCRSVAEKRLYDVSRGGRLARWTR